MLYQIITIALILIRIGLFSPHASASDMPNHNQTVRTLQVSYEGDLEMNCGEISREASLMRDIIFTTQDIKDESTVQKAGIGVAGAIGSFLVGTATGGLGLAAAGFIANEASDNKSEDADSVQDIAKQRRTLMLGIYNAKGCLGPIDHALKNPEELEIMSIDNIASIEPSSGTEKKHKRQEFNQ